MADNENAQGDVNAASRASENASAKRKLLAAAIVSLVIIAESVVAYLVFPSAQDTAARAEARLGDAVAAEDEMDSELAKTNNKPLVEVPLGDFTVSAYQPASNTTLRIDFRLYGLALEDDEPDLIAELERSQHRFREQVIVTVRSSETTDLSDPSLGLIKRKLLEKTNRWFAKTLLQEIIIDDFSFVEQ